VLYPVNVIRDVCAPETPLLKKIVDNRGTSGGVSVSRMAGSWKVKVTQKVRGLSPMRTVRTEIQST